MTTKLLPASGSPQLALLMASLVEALRSPNPQAACDAILFRTSEKVNRSMFVSLDDAMTPSWYFADTGLDAVVAIDGTTNILQALNITNGYVGGLLDSVSAPINQFIADCGDRIGTRLASTVSDRLQRICFAGWSLGGAVAEATLNGHAYQSQAWARPNCITFGAPRWSGRGVASGLQGSASSWRLMNTNDPIPLVPPTALDTPLVVALFGIRGAQRAANFYHSPGGSVLHEDGHLTTGFTPTDATPNFTSSFADWMLALDQGNAPAHAISTYISRLENLVETVESTHSTRTTPVNGSQVRVARVEPRGGGERGVLTTAERNSLGVILNLQRTQNNTPVVIPETMRYRAVRIGRLWFVFFGDQQITVCANKRTARHMARVSNAQLQAMQHLPVVDAAGLVTAMQKYLVAATDVAGDFEPVMNTTFPAA